MKSKLFLGLTLLATVLFSCQKPEEEEGPGVTPVAVSTSIADGATDIAVTIGVIDITYDIPVTILDETRISFSDMKIAATTLNKLLRLEFDSLAGNTEYTLLIGAGAIGASSDNTPCEEFSLTFTTEVLEEPEPEPPYEPGEPGNYSTTLAMDNPIPNAVRLYDYLLSIYGNYTLTGAMAKVNWNKDEAEWVYKWTGLYPAMATFDYIHLADSPANWIDYGDITPAREWFEAGGIVSACWHWNVPIAEGNSEYSFYSDGNSFKASNVPVEGTWENEVAVADLSKMAGYLKLLQDEGIPVIWRPLHEASGNIYSQWQSTAWFWWGNDGAEAYKALWKFMFDFFETQGIRNLIWVWTTQTSAPVYSDIAFYPGDEYVDIVGRDIYDNTDTADIAYQFETITHMITNKMVALSENGGVPDMDTQWEGGAKWLYSMPWYDNDNDWSEGYAHRHATIDWWKKTFECPAALDRSELPKGLYE